MKKCTLIALSMLVVITLSAQRDWDKIEIKTEKVADNLYVLFGSGGNIGVAVGEKSVYMIDDQFAPLTDKILAAIGKITDKPVQYVVNTHWHGDHAGGNENLGQKGAIIVAHENVRKRMSTKQVRGGGRITAPSPNSALPQITFKEELSMYPDSINPMLAIHVPHAHTDGDILIYFPTSNVMHMGDTFFNGRYPYIDIASGGSIDGIIKAADRALFIVDEETKIIPGHGQVGSRADLVAYREVLMNIRTRVKQQRDKGKTLEEVQAMELSKEWDQTHGQAFINGKQIIEFAFKSLE